MSNFRPAIGVVAALEEKLARGLKTRGLILADSARLRALIKDEEFGAYRTVEGVGRACCPWCNGVGSHGVECPAFDAAGNVK